MDTGIVNVSNAFLYQRPDDTSVTDEIFMGWAVGILEEQKEYSKIVTHYGYQGYLKNHMYLRCPKEQLRERDCQKNTFYVCRSFADVMEFPDIKSRVLTTLLRGSFVEIIEGTEEKGYQKAALSNGISGYIPKLALSKRLDKDGYLYEVPKENFFMCQKQLQELPCEILRWRISEQAKHYLGTQYRWGGKSSEGLDCSGMTFMSYQMCGIIIYRDAKIVPGYPVREIMLEDVKLGDLLFFPGHVAMYLEHGKYIHTTANSSSFGCVINSLRETDGDYRKDLKEQLLCAGSVF